jgi:hypothetical protein
MKSSVREISSVDWRQLFIIAQCAIIGVISIYDMYMTVRYASSLKYMERNPVGRWIMQLDQLQNGELPDLTLFLSAKSIGTLMVVAIIAMLYRRRHQIAQPVALGVTLFQILLGGYLTLATE